LQRSEGRDFVTVWDEEQSKWIQRRLKEPGYYTKQVEEQFKEVKDERKAKRKADPPKYYNTIFELSEQDRLQAERMLKP